MVDSGYIIEWFGQYDHTICPGSHQQWRPFYVSCVVISLDGTSLGRSVPSALPGRPPPG